MLRIQDVAQIEAFRDAQADDGRDRLGYDWVTAVQADLEDGSDTGFFLLEPDGARVIQRSALGWPPARPGTVEVDLGCAHEAARMLGCAADTNQAYQGQDGPRWIRAEWPETGSSTAPIRFKQIPCQRRARQPEATGKARITRWPGV
jgi:hypothetical protein